MTLDEAVGKMKVYLVNSGKMTPQQIQEMFGDPSDPSKLKLCKDPHAGPGNDLITVDAKVKNWLVKKFAAEIDCVVVKGGDDMSESESEEEEAHGYAQDSLDHAERKRIELLNQRRMSLRTVGHRSSNRDSMRASHAAASSTESGKLSRAETTML
jgi:hypothetical protein|eukprot:COSAG01_NODE_2628_length_7351_cov_3.274645_7_plen_155_part_00